MTAPTAVEQKRALRAELRAAIRAIPAEYFASSGRAISEKLLALPEYSSAKTVFCFVGTEREPDTGGFLRRALSDGKRVAVPLCTGPGVMEAREITSLRELSTGFYGIPEPPAESVRVREDEIDFAVIPCLSCSRAGARLGRGGGYYDRFLARFGGFAALICPEKLIRDNIPTELHDIVIPQVITEL